VVALARDSGVGQHGSKGLLVKVALVVDHFLPRVGGIELHVADLARQLHARGHAVSVISATPGPADLDGIPVHRLSGPLLPHFEILCHLRPLNELRALLQRENFSVVHAHSSIVSPLSYAATYFCHQLGIPSILTAHSLFGPHRPAFRTANYVFKLTAWCRRLTTVSEASARALRQISRRDDVSILPNGIDLADWQQTPEDHDELRVTSVMRLNVKKRPQDLVRAIPQIKRLLPAEIRPKFAVIGDGPYRSHLERMARRLGIEQDIEFLGFLPRTEIQKVFRKTDLFVLPTINEAFGIAVLEARCAGLPVVARSNCGVSDIIQHGEHGLLAGDCDQFASCIAELLMAGETRHRMSQSGQQGLCQFDWRCVIERHLETYRAVMGTPARSTLEKLPA
jgi:glycosyltransferase involved in cell wall biosynthesis